MDILLSDIIPDPDQPRRFFDPVKLQELTDAVRKKGVLQPITVRPYGDIPGKYKIVFGERRWRASKAVMALFPNRNTIPSIVKELSDEEALEEQIMENLHRHDMKPIEEAVTFRRMNARHSLEEMSLRIGKSPDYIAQRMKLCDLIPEWQELLFADKMRLTVAFKLARIPEKAQTDIYEEANVPEDWSSQEDWQLPDWVDINEEKHDLSAASFDIKDASLYPEAGACTTCQYNSHCSRLLFPDLQQKPICNNNVCYDIKSSRAYRQSIEQAMSDPDVLFVTTQHYLSGDDKKKVAAVTDMGVKILGNDMIEVVAEPEMPPTWEDFLESEKEDYDWQELEEAEQRDFEQQWQDEYDSLVTRYQEEVEEYREAEKSGQLKKAFIVAGYRHEGKITTVRIKGKLGIAAANVQTGASADLVHLESEIDEIKSRAKRNLELDREKVYKKLIKLFKPETNPFFSNDGRLTPEECSAFLIALIENCSPVRDLVQQELKVKNVYHGLDLFHAIQKGTTHALLQRSIRLFMYHKLVSETDSDYGKNRRPAAFYSIGRQYFPKELTELEKDQQETATKRRKNVSNRIKALEKKKAALTTPQEGDVAEADPVEAVELSA